MDSNDSENESDGPGPLKRAKIGALIRIYKTKFNYAWKNIYLFIREVKDDAYKFFLQLVVEVYHVSIKENV